MGFDYKLFDWENEGYEPSDDLKKAGFQYGDKPPASIFNRFWHLTSRAINELQKKTPDEDNLLSVNKGGTGAETKEKARENLGAQAKHYFYKLDEIGCTADSSPSDVWNAMPNSSVLAISAGTFSNEEWNFPTTYATLFILKPSLGISRGVIILYVKNNEADYRMFLDNENKPDGVWHKIYNSCDPPTANEVNAFSKTSIIPVENGGTGANNAGNALANLSGVPWVKVNCDTFTDFWTQVCAAAKNITGFVGVRVKDEGGWGPTNYAGVWFNGFAFWQNAPSATYDTSGTVVLRQDSTTNHALYKGVVRGITTDGFTVEWSKMFDNDMIVPIENGGTKGATRQEAFNNIVAPGGTMTGKLNFNNNLGINALLSDGTTAGMIGRNEHNNLWLGSATNEAQGDVFLATNSSGNAFVSRNNVRTKILDYGIVGKTLWTGSWAVGEAKTIDGASDYTLFLAASGANATPVLLYRNGTRISGGGFYPSGSNNWSNLLSFTISENTLTYTHYGCHTVSLSNGAIGNLVSDDFTLVKLIGIV